MGFLLVLEGSEAAELKLQLISGVGPELFCPGPVHPPRVCRNLLLNKDLALLEMGQRPDVGLIPGRPLQLPGVPGWTRASFSSDTLRIKREPSFSSERIPTPSKSC